jgi:hypothetical protein
MMVRRRPILEASKAFEKGQLQKAEFGDIDDRLRPATTTGRNGDKISVTGHRALPACRGSRKSLKQLGNTMAPPSASLNIAERSADILRLANQWICRDSAIHRFVENFFTRLPCAIP